MHVDVLVVVSPVVVRARRPVVLRLVVQRVVVVRVRGVHAVDAARVVLRVRGHDVVEVVAAPAAGGLAERGAGLVVGLPRGAGDVRGGAGGAGDAAVVAGAAEAALEVAAVAVAVSTPVAHQRLAGLVEILKRKEI